MSRIARLLATAVRRVASLLGDESGATAIEYAIIAAGVGATVAGTVWHLGGSINATLYSKIGSALN
jgi:Flp pilus assembly pilin Flp